MLSTVRVMMSIVVGSFWLRCSSSATVGLSAAKMASAMAVPVSPP